MKNKFYMLIMQALLPCMIFAQNYTFTAMRNCPEPITGPAVLTFGDSIYLVSGCIGNAAGAPKNLTQHVWLYNTLTDTWVRKSDYPGLAVYGTSSFVINGLGYIANGWDSTETGSGPNNLWQYNPATDSWASKAPFPGPTRYTSASFAVGGKGYIGMGFKPLTNDMWEYDPATNTWTQLADFPGVARQAPVWFTIGNYAYVGMGAVDVPGGFYLQSDFYRFDPSTNTWDTLGVFPGNPKASSYSFVVNGQAYMVSGNEQNSLDYLYTAESKDVWKYDPGADNWSLWGLFPDTAISGGVAGSANNNGYMGLGIWNNITYPIVSNWYRFGPGVGPYNCSATISALFVNSAEVNFLAQGNFSPSATLSWSFGDGGTGYGTSVFHSYDSVGTYTVILNVTDTANGGCSSADTTTVTISGLSNCSATLSNTSIGVYNTLYANATGVAPYTYIWSDLTGYTFSNSPDPLVYVPAGDSATFCVVITDSTGCQAHACEKIFWPTDTTVVSCQTYLYIYPDLYVPGLYYGYVYHTGATPVTYIWSYGNGVVDSIPGDSTPNYNYNTFGFFDICLTIIDSANCSSSYCDSLFYAYKVGGGPMNQFKVVTTPPTYATGIGNVSGTSLMLSVYPNPATDQLAIVANKQIDYLNVYSDLGQIIKHQEAPTNNTIDIASLASGIYFVDVHIGNNSGRVKFVKTN